MSSDATEVVPEVEVQAPAVPEPPAPDPDLVGDDCCPGEPCYGDPRGLHTFDCPVYLANVKAWEERTRDLRSREMPRWLADAAVADPAGGTALGYAAAGYVAGRAEGTPADTLASWDAWQCEQGARYRENFPEHGAPDRCGCRLVPVEVVIYRRRVK